MFRKLFITLICIGTICFSFTMVATGDDKTGEETIQLPLPSATETEEIKLPDDSKKKDASAPEETTIELTTGTGEITPESEGKPGDSIPADRQVQVMTKYLKRNELHVYNLQNLKAGETLYVYLERISGNLDPFTGIADVTFDAALFEKLGEDKGRQALKAKHDLTSFLSELFEDIFFAWNDDGGTGYNAALEFPIPADDDYKLVIVQTGYRWEDPLIGSRIRS